MLNRTVPNLPGRLGNPDLILRDDPRVDPRIIKLLSQFDADGETVPVAVTVDAAYEARLAHYARSEPDVEAFATILVKDVPEPAGVENSVAVLKGVDDNEITVYIHRPEHMNRALPGVLHLHGGGMTIISAANPLYTRWRQQLAAAGLVVVGVEFRNAAGALGPHPFPAGLNDCMSALQWMNDNKDKLGVDKIVISGDSGGGNLSLASALMAKQNDCLKHINGVYALCPYISNEYLHNSSGLPSLTENDTYSLNRHNLALMASMYDGADSTNPLAWPLHATAKELSGLPPHVISVNELDPLRDEGLSYYRKLMAAGVMARSRTVNGTCHANDVLFQQTIPEISAATVRDIHGFAMGL